MPTVIPGPLRPPASASDGFVPATRLKRERDDAPPARERGAAEERAFVDSGDLYVEREVRAKDEAKEVAVKQRRVWVRVTRLCNQRCTFCLDSWNQNGTYVPRAELEAFIRRGREEGGQRLILSGGEATVHPDFLRLVRFGKELGYEWIQTVTNGQVFAYPDFARKAKLAGLDEATFSMHGHTPKLHDALVGLPGAFERGNQGIRNLQALGGVVTNVDVVVNKQNAPYLRDILDFYLDMGIHEFDLLFIVPFGRGFEDFREQLFLDPRAHHEHFQRAFEVSRRPGVFLWTNRFPVAHLEGYEHLIQDPHKLHSEVNGGRHNFDGYLQTGTPPDCYGERCAHCFLEGLCRTEMFAHREALLGGAFERVRVNAEAPAGSPRAEAAFDTQDGRDAEVVGGTLDQRLAELDARPWLGHERAAVEVRDEDERARAEAHPRVTHLLLWDVSLLGLARRPAALHLDQAGAQALLGGAAAEARSRAVLRLQNHHYLSESRAIDPAPEALRALAARGWALENVPECIGGARAVPGRHRELERGMLSPRGDLDTDAYVDRYIAGEYYAKSLRCEGCARHDTCPGMHINYLRNHGFGILQPLPGASGGSADASGEAAAGAASAPAD